MSKVSRSIYQKVVEENKRLRADLKIIVMAQKPLSDLEKETIVKYRKEFQQQDYFNLLMKEVASKYVAEHPEEFKFLKAGSNTGT